MKRLGIYKIRNVVNQKFYVGSSNDTKDRFRKHRNLLRKNMHHCKHLQAAWNKYGEECFRFEVIEGVVVEADLFTAENVRLQEWVGRPECYNSGRSAEAPMRGMPKELTPNWGKTVSPEVRAQISATLKATYAADPSGHPRLGTKHTDEVKALIKAKKLANPTRYWAGMERSAETREKIAAAQRGVKKEPRVYTPEGLARAQENMRRHAQEQVPALFADVYAKFPQEVKAEYSFNKARYLGALVRIGGCVCPTHGVFSQYAAQFRKGRGCPECGAERRAQMLAARKKA